MKKLFLFLKGILFGISNLIPGASGGTTLVICGIYEDTISSISNIFKKFKASFIFLLFLALGTIIGFVGGAKVINISLDHAPFIVINFFIGIILGSIPLFAKPIIKKTNIKYFITFLVSMIIVGAIVIVTNIFNKSTTTVIDNLEIKDYILLFICGFVGIGMMLLPGVSGILLFYILGYYPTVMNAIANITDFANIGSNLKVLLPIALGIICGIIPCAKLIHLFMKKFPVGIYFAILGFIFASVFSIYYSFYNSEYAETLPSVLMLNLGIIALVVGVIISYSLSLIKNKRI